MSTPSARPSEPPGLDRWLNEVRGLSRDEFAKRHPHHFLVLFTIAEPDGEAHGLAFKTEVADDSGEAGATMSVVALTKAEGSPYPDRVSIGRARNCDAVIRHQSVSKLHAHFRVDGGQATLSDLGSRVGTFVGGKRLEKDSPKPVKPGAHVRFGDVAGNLFDAPGLWSALGRLGAGR